MQKSEPIVLTEEQLKEATVLVANLNPNRKVAVIDMNVLEYLVRNLPEANIYIIKKNFGQLLLSDVSIDTIEKYTDALANELAFHSSINMVKEHFLPLQAATIRVNGQKRPYFGEVKPEVVGEINGD